ncbi:hypothetical protein QYE76_046050 [Lolium multiflorum]|uniref:Retrotransposon Copia-like N-terminal domain-containing protein n=1 Tax=Lolium multiflorum TaxID=4521 RepID=A0AAD8WY12_LOLMU|nr:hypothetical protein QYE76_046050 [Lolium multiflorum]
MGFATAASLGRLDVMSSSSSPAMSSSALATALGAPPAQQLTRSNFLLWKALVLPAFRGANVMQLLDGSDRAPTKTIEVEDSEKNKVMVPNSAYIYWMAKDQQVLRFLLNTLSPDVLSHLLEVISTAQAWASINAMFKTTSRTKAQHLRGELSHTKKLSLTADQYYTKMRGFASELYALGKHVEDDELLGYLLLGLDKGEYNALITTVNGNPGTSLDEFYEQLSSYDMRNGVEENGSFVSSAYLARRGDPRSRARTPPARGRSPPPPRARSPYRGGGSYRDDDTRSWRHDDGRGNGNWCRDDNWRRDDRRGDDRHGDRRDDRRRDDGGGRRSDGRRSDRVPTPYVDTECQICKKHGHPANACWWRYSDDKKDRDDGEKGENLASYGVDTNWYTDTGATDHITSELNKLLIANKYHGQDRVGIAEGSELGEDSSEHSSASADLETLQTEADSPRQAPEASASEQTSPVVSARAGLTPAPGPSSLRGGASDQASPAVSARAGHMPAPSPSSPRGSAGSLHERSLSLHATDFPGASASTGSLSPSGSSAPSSVGGAVGGENSENS